jgi:hypothetical protein
MATLLSRTALLSAKLPHRDVPVPEMGPDATVRVRQMSVNTRAAYLERIRQHRQALFAYEDDQELPAGQRKGVAKPADLDIGILALVYSLVDEDGNTMFVEADMPLFNEWAHNAVTRIYEEVIALNQYDQSPSAAVEIEKKD